MSEPRAHRPPLWGGATPRGAAPITRCPPSPPGTLFYPEHKPTSNSQELSGWGAPGAHRIRWQPRHLEMPVLPKPRARWGMLVLLIAAVGRVGGPQTPQGGGRCGERDVGTGLGWGPRVPSQHTPHRLSARGRPSASALSHRPIRCSGRRSPLFGGVVEWGEPPPGPRPHGATAGGS